ncbi:MAG TPA: DUF4143 domain-containing protein [Chitinophagaceae bacterium]|nr:DUF4143 domain-containing protein [Chitinophagaceae bacterium]HNU12978.1 DUF4143 domain-containing protein [Chitinophagaceae bacterium]
MEKLVQALAFQTAQLISYNELGQLCGLNAETVEKYINLLEKAFIAFRLPSFGRNLRNDTGQLWENWFISERMKFLNNCQQHVSRFFWRTLAQQEVDYIEDANGTITAFECKWNPKVKGAVSRAFSNAYPTAVTHIVNPENAGEFLL